MTSCYKQPIRFNVGVEQHALDSGVISGISVNFEQSPHLGIGAPTGSGKTYCLTYILGQLARQDIGLILADFKGIDFISFSECCNYYKHSAVADAFNRVFDLLQSRMANPKPANELIPVIFCIDELAGFIYSLPSKKEQDAYKQQLASILMLGRGLRIFCIISMQRFDAALISGRDNLSNFLGLGTQSKEAVAMMFSDFKDQIKPKDRGQGYLNTDGKPLREIVVPKLRNRAATLSTIRSALSRPPPEN